MSTPDDDLKSHSKSPIDDSFRELKLLNYSRPLTAKRSEKDPLKTQKKTLSRANPTPKPKRISTKDRFTPILSKIKPNRVKIDKEKLYNENIALKLKLNEMKSVIIKYKSRIMHLEKEVQKKEDEFSTKNPNINSSLVKLLKQTVKDLRAEVENKNLEIEKHKKNMKLSRFLEQELETKAYIDECTRLRHLLEDVLSESSEENTGKVGEISEVKTLNLLKIIEENNKEIQKLKDKLRGDSLGKTSKTPKFQEEFSKVSKELESVKKALIHKEKKFGEEVEGLKASIKIFEKENIGYKGKLEESNSIIKNLYKELKSLRQKKKSKLTPPKILQIIHKILQSEPQSINSFLSRISSQKSDFVFTKDLFSNLKLFDETFNQSDIDLVISYIKHESINKISIQKLADYYESFDFSFLSKKNQKNKVLELFQHINLRMQLHRIHKENLVEALLGTGIPTMKELIDQDMVYLFTSSPFDFTRKQATCLVEYLFEGKKAIACSQFMDKFYTSIKDWQVFTAADEEYFDRILLSMVSEHKAGIEDHCSAIDKENKGILTLDEFFQFIEKNKIVLVERMKEYLTVLFYSNNLELNSVPYKQFLQAYSAQEDSGDDPKTTLVHKYLERISTQLINLDKSVREVFAFDKNGLILTENFVEGLEALEIDDMPKDHVEVMMESLQFDLEKRVFCICVDELEDIMETFGVPIQNRLDTSEIFSENELFNEPFEGHVQKISCLDSFHLEILASPST